MINSTLAAPVTSLKLYGMKSSMKVNRSNIFSVSASRRCIITTTFTTFTRGNYFYDEIYSLFLSLYYNDILYNDKNICPLYMSDLSIAAQFSWSRPAEVFFVDI